MIKLIDVSSAQNPKTIDWQKVKANGIQGAYIRCGDGLHSVDPAFSEHWRRASDVGILTGAYYVLAPSTKDPIGSAQHATQCAGDTVLPLCIDVERNSPLGADAPQWVDFLQRTLSYIQGGTTVYTYRSFLAEMVKAGFTAPKWLFLAAYPELHYSTPQAEVLRRLVLDDIKAYTIALTKNDAKAASAALNKKFTDGAALSKFELEPTPTGTPPNGVMWQWGGDANAATCPGVLGLCDRSTFYGSDEDWSLFRRWPPRVEQPAPGGGNRYTHPSTTPDPPVDPPVDPNPVVSVPTEPVVSLCQKIRSFFQ